MDGSLIRCGTPFSGANDMIGWIDGDRILISNGLTSSRSTPMKARTHRPGSCKRAGNATYRLMGDGCGATSRSPVRSRIGSGSDPRSSATQARRILCREGRLVRPAWHWAGAPTEYLDSVAILAQTDTIPLARPFKSEQRVTPIFIGTFGFTRSDGLPSIRRSHASIRRERFGASVRAGHDRRIRRRLARYSTIVRRCGVADTYATDRGLARTARPSVATLWRSASGRRCGLASSDERS